MSTSDTCHKMNTCVRVAGHSGVCTAAPSARTLDWDEHAQERREEHINAAVTLLALDFPAPPWADLLDDDQPKETT